MVTIRFIVVAACLLLAFTARAQDTAKQPSAVSDLIYKGIVGKALDAVQMDPDKRLALQRTNAVVSSSLTGRSLAAWAGLSNPILLAAGVAWGIYSAINIKAVADTKPDAIRVNPGPLQMARMAEPPAGVDIDAVQCSPYATATESVVVAEADSVRAAPTLEQFATGSAVAEMISTRF